LVTVLVDAENVRRSRWPNLSREELVERCEAWSQAKSRAVVVVFDGDPPAVGSHVELIGSGRASADDRLVEEARRRATAGSIWLVTSDRELRERAKPSVERTIGGGSFLNELLGVS
jgi:hypothetical protein